MWNIETRMEHTDGTHSVRTFTVYGRSMEQALMRGRLIVRAHLSALRYGYKDAKIVRVVKS
jgi:hypothetical protein